MKRLSQVSVPGKVILMGEHAVVYGRPALIAALGRRLRVRVARGRRGVELDLPDVGHREDCSWPDVVEAARRARRAWSEYLERPSSETFGRLRSDDPAHLVKLALGEAVEAVGHGEGTGGSGTGPPPVEVRIESDLPPGAGLGSSAAVAVGVVAAMLDLLGAGRDPALVERLALEVERRQHGRPSGVDHQTVLRGGVVAARRCGDGLALEPLTPAAEALDRLRILHSGRPAESTGQVVEAVREQRARDPERFEALLDRMEAAAGAFARLLGGDPYSPSAPIAFDSRMARDSPRDPDSPESGRSSDPYPALARPSLPEAVLPDPVPPDLGPPIREYEACLEALGVVPEPVQVFIREAEARGAAAKVSGAGALSGAAAGCLLWCAPAVAGGSEPDPLPAGWRGYRAPLGVEGLRWEEAE